MKCKQNSDGRAIDHQSLQVMRQQAFKAVANGESPTRVAKAFGVNVRNVFRWLADFASGGQKALQAKPIPGRPQKVAPDEMRGWRRQLSMKHRRNLNLNTRYGLWRW